MRKILVSCAFVTLFAALAFAESFSGTLLDASCYSQQKSATACAASGSTTAFALSVSGKVYNLDDAGNTKAAAAMKNRADRSTDQSAQKTPTAATVTGTQDGDTIKVESIQVQ